MAFSKGVKNNLYNCIVTVLGVNNGLCFSTVYFYTEGHNVYNQFYFPEMASNSLTLVY